MDRARSLSALFLVAVLLAGCGHAGGGRGRRARPAVSPNPIPTVAAKLTTVRAASSISGVIAPFQNVAITSSLVEPTDAVRVLEGDRVRAGEVIAVLDTADLRAQLAQAQATVQTDIRNAESADAKITQARYTQKLNIGQGGDQVHAMRAALAQAQQTLRNDQANLVRDQQLVADGYVAQQTVDQQMTTVVNDRAAIRTAEANLASAITNQQVNGTQTVGLQAADVQSAIADANALHATVAQARASVQQLQTQIAKATIVSPVNGIIVNRNLNPGEYPGSRTIFTIQELDKVYAMLNASSTDTFAIPAGATVSLTVAGNTTRTYTGKVVAVLGQVTPGSTNFTVEALLTNPDGKLQSGLPVTASVALPPVHGIGIPTTAFLDDTHTTVMVAEDELVDTVAKTVHVKELGSDGTTSIVSGLKAGTSVISNGQLGVTDGQSLAQN
ncbi:MAG TPA: efflux RND transporter periplasmic adaptor subunit [Candidatus Limnocylindria bacterium]|nr:efflux RND transporter periplasmic adaptor subunit [Candidatus Limnocylindria bacterium]